MKLISYLETENFKLFGGKQRITLNHPSVLIGPNNCGKTTAIQAIALWSRAIQEAKASSPPKTQLAEPSQQLQSIKKSTLPPQMFWHNTVMRKDGKDIPMSITVGLQHDNKSVPITVHFYGMENSLLNFKLDTDTRNKLDVLHAAENLNVGLVHSISAIQDEERVIQPEHINSFVVNGQVAQLIRNICLFVYKRSPETWKKIVDQVEHIFSIEIQPPFETSHGTIELFYKQNGVMEPLNISFAGQGLQQILVILICLYSYNQSILLIDEPDTHLGIAQQHKLYTLLRDIPKETGAQIVLTTHSRDLIAEAWDDGNVVLFTGKNIKNIKSKKDQKATLDTLFRHGATSYFKAIKYRHILYLEGDTDLKILHAFAKKLRHSVEQYLNPNELEPFMHIYYIKNSSLDFCTELDSQSTKKKYSKVASNFFSLQTLVPDLCGLAILDSDGKLRQDTKNRLHTMYWGRREIEHYFITPNLLIESISNHYKNCSMLNKRKMTALKIFDELVIEFIFNKNQNDFDNWNKTLPEARQQQWLEKTTACKLSRLAEKFYRRFSNEPKCTMLYTKGTLYRLIELVEPESIPEEIIEKLDLIWNLLENSKPHE